MVQLATIRLACILILLGLWSAFPRSALTVFFLGFLFSHYLLAITYARKRVKGLVSSSEYVVPLLVLCGMGIVVFWQQQTMVVLIIGVHIALAETYMVDFPLKRTPAWKMEDLNTLRLVLYVAMFCALLHHYPHFSWMPIEILVALIAVTWVGSLVLVYTRKERFTKGQLADLLTFDLIGVVLAAVVLWQGIVVAHTDIVFYHILTWAFFPAWQFVASKNPRRLAIFAGSVVLSTGVFYLLARRIDLAGQIPIWVTVHILSSLALSKLNPSIIRNLFQEPVPT